MIQGTIDYPNIQHRLPKRYDTGWINRSDWTNVHMGSDTTLNTDSDVEHNLNANLSQLLVKVLISTDGTDGNSFEVGQGSNNNVGWTVYQVDTNNILIQTGSTGIGYQAVNPGGVSNTIDSDNWYYKIVVIRL